MNLEQVLQEDILHRVEKPSRYLGTELNAVHKDRDEVEIRVALAFPDLYDLGLGNLGLHILYACVNRFPWAWCERVYAPGLDMEAQLRERGLPLFGLESKDSLDQFDLIGITLQSELTYTNILNIIDMAGVPLRSEDRAEDAPLFCAGGPAVFNPEPIAPFMDFFVIGDGEDAIVEIVELLRAMKGRTRDERLDALAKLEGVYVPARYPFYEAEDGQILPDPDAPKIVKRLTKDLNGSTFPTDYIVPYTQQVHDRVSLEVLRGCTQGCRFCQAGMVTRPVRERTITNVGDLMDRTLKNTGYEEVSLVSLSTCDHSRVRALVQDTVERARPKRVSVSLPSLRLDSFSVELADMVGETRRTGLTFAPEAASPRLRAVINKWIPDEGLLEMSRGAFERGWGHVKLYFMIGLPTERDDDIEAIADLSRRTVDQGRQITSRARVNLGVSTFVPKPFTPFQWAAQIDIDETRRKQDVLEAALGRHKAIKFGRHDPEETYLEGLVSRSDRRAADLLEAAFRRGCRFDAWREHLQFDQWLGAVEDVSFDVPAALRERDPEEPLPWDHIDVMIPKSWFQWDWQRALELKHAEDCRHKKCHKCGVIFRERELCAHMLRNSIQGRKPESEFVRTPVPQVEEPPPVQRLWFRIARRGPARFLSHLEAMNAWMRALRRVEMPLAYSQGFHPHPKLAFSAALPVGQESLGEYMDVTLVAKVDPIMMLTRLRDTMPQGLEVLAVTEVPLNSKALMVLNQGGAYTIALPNGNRDELEARVQAILNAAELPVQRKGKQRKGKRRTVVMRTIDIRPMLVSATLRDGDVPAVDLVITSHDGRPGKAREFVPMLTDDPEGARIIKLDTLTLGEDGPESLGRGWCAPGEAKAWSKGASAAESSHP